MADEKISQFNDTSNELDYDYMDMSPEPQPLHQRNTGMEDAKDDSFTNDSEYNSHNASNIMLRQFQNTIGELQQELQSAQNESENLMVKNETLIIEYDAKIDELNIEIDELQIEAQQYQIRYGEINEELHELRSKEADSLSSGKEKSELLLLLQSKEQNEMSLMIELEQSHKQNDTLKQQTKKQNENISTLQKAMLQLKKDKTTLDKNLVATLHKYDIFRQQSQSEITQISQRLQQLERENEIYRQNLSYAEAEKVEMQNNFTEATMELLHDELNDANNDGVNENDANPMRLGRIDSVDLDRRANNDSMDITMFSNDKQSHFIKQRFGSNVSLPDQNLLVSLEDEQHRGYHHQLQHSRKSSLGSQMGAVYDFDPMKLKQDIKDILVNDIKILFSEEMSNIQIPTTTDTNNNNNGFDPKLFAQFESSINDKIKSVLESGNNMKQFEAIINEEIKKILQSINNLNANISENISKQLSENENKSDNEAQKMAEMKEILSQTIENQMSVFQISLENQIGSAVSENMTAALSNDSGNTQLRQDIKADLTQLLNENNTNNDSELINEEVINKKLESAMSGKIDGFMDEFRKEVIPEFMAMFEQLNTNNSQINNYSAAGSNCSDVDDEKEQLQLTSNKNSELSLMNEALKAEIETLKSEKQSYDRILRSAATSKVHQVVKLQNLLDHMRNDNRLLQFQLGKYQQTFAKFKQNQENNLLSNRFWGYFGQNTGNTTHLST